MCRVSLEKHVGEEAKTLATKTFSQVAGAFLNPAFVPTHDSKHLIRQCFIGVALDDARIAFLKCPWPYVYTLNIDDGIESNSPYKTKVLPNRLLAQDARVSSCVYKVHGDATEEILYDEPSKIIFSTGQYVGSLTTNSSMLNSLRTDLTDNNTLFVGCSLANEIDLLFTMAGYHGRIQPNRKSIFVTSSDLGKLCTSSASTA